MDIESSIVIINSTFCCLFINNPYSWLDGIWWIDKIGTPLSIVTAIDIFLWQRKSDFKKRNEDEKCFVA